MLHRFYCLWYILIFVGSQTAGIYREQSAQQLRVNVNKVVVTDLATNLSKLQLLCVNLKCKF